MTDMQWKDDETQRIPVVQQSEEVKPQRKWYTRKRVWIPAAVVVLIVGAGLAGGAEPPSDTDTATPPATSTPVVPPPVKTPQDNPPAVDTPAVPPSPPPGGEVGSAAWLVSSMREQDAGFNQLSDDQIVQLADNTCDYREANGPSGEAIKNIGLRSGFTEHQAEVLSTQTYVYCQAQA